MGEFDSNPVAKSLKAYHDAKATGASDGSMAGYLGAADRKKEQEKASSSWSSSSSSSSNSSSKVICTELHRQGLMSRADYLLGARFASEHLTEHYRGYHAWALPVVRHMRRSKTATAFWRKLAAARADHIAFLNGDAARTNQLGALLSAIGHPVCYALGALVKEQDWQSLYARDVTRAME